MRHQILGALNGTEFHFEENSGKKSGCPTPISKWYKFGSYLADFPIKTLFMCKMDMIFGISTKN